LFDIIPFLFLGIFAGFFAGLLGIGGGLIIVPALLFLLTDNVAPALLMHTAVATALAAIVFTSFSSVSAHHRHGAIHWQYFRKLTPMILLGAFSGALLTQFMSFDFMRLFFAVFELSVAAIMFFELKSTHHAHSLNRWVWRLSGYFIGLISAIVGIGGGTLTTPFLTYNKVDIKNAIATSAAVGMPIAIAGVLGFMIADWSAQNANAGLGFIHLEALFGIVLMSVLFAPFGAKVAHQVDGRKLKKFFAIFLAVLGLSVLSF
jgi:uncharacterized membrane protein YfcA